MPTDPLHRTDDGSATLWSDAAQQTYHSGRGALAEARHVFLAGSGVADRLADPSGGAGRPLHVLEVGLGTGLNLLLTLDAQARRRPPHPLIYRALEAATPDPALVDRLGYEAHLHAPSLAAAWRAVLTDLHARGAPPGPPDPYAFAPAPDARLEVALGPATDARGAPHGAAATALAPGTLDAIYHDAFSPDASPALWSEAFLAACARALRPGGRWVSYTVAGAVRRRLAAAGLDVRKAPGPPGGKREMTVATRPTPET
ncbi:MAG: tRNA (5-methylaminomethyl-2-thiouridine)(34)-methyltransferase MnmD [Trueperaceae bacterium]|nr:tRNA (5-methylaminomethyl-2-thiouridine)(34)-methyltransferase MnmD [Trueperaceae bacterium]